MNKQIKFIKSIFRNSAVKAKAGVVYIPEELCSDLLSKLPIDFKPKDIAVVNALDGCLVVLTKDKYPDAKIVCLEVDDIYKYHLENLGFTVELFEECSMKFDLIVGNPPYQDTQEFDAKRGGGTQIWPAFVEKSSKLLNDNGILSFIHPAGWRKPSETDNISIQRKVWNILTTEFNIEYLSIHDTKDGKKTFNAGTRYDWYVARKTKARNKTTIKGEDKEISTMYINDFDFLPNKNYKMVFDIVATKTEKKCTVIFDNTYEQRKPHVSDTQTSDFKYPLVHTTAKTGVRYMYTNDKKGHFGVPKVIFGDSGIDNPINDYNGNYGMTAHAIGIKILDKDDGDKLIEYLKSPTFKDVLESCMWSNFQIDWKLFATFKDGFWR